MIRIRDAVPTFPCRSAREFRTGPLAERAGRIASSDAAVRRRRAP